MRTERLTLRQCDPGADSDVEAAFDIYRRAEVAVAVLTPPASGLRHGHLRPLHATPTDRHRL